MADVEELALTADLSSVYASIASIYSSSTVDNSTLALINSLVFAESKSVRTSTVILAVFNVLAALGTTISILHDSSWVRRPVSPGSKAKQFCASTIHPAETFPLIQAIGIVIQGVIFAAAQGTGLKALVEPGCRITSQFMFPAVFLVGFIQIVFGIECAIRSLRSIPFQPRGKYGIAICLAIVFLLELAAWLVSFLKHTTDDCFSSLMWFTAMYPITATVLCSVILGFALIPASIIFVRLSTVSNINEHQRIAASRMVYYLIVGLVSMAFVIPFYIMLLTGDNALTAAMIATVVLNLSGLMTGLLQLFLRANTATSAFKPKGAPCGIKKHDIRIWGPNELSYGGPMSMPIPGTQRSAKFDSRISYPTFEKSRSNSVDSMESPLIENMSKGIQLQPVESKFAEKPSAVLPNIREVSPSRGLSRKPSYSLYPSDDVPYTASKAFLPATTFNANSRNENQSVYDLSDLVPPPRIFSGSRHKRDSSLISHATVQIGLRISNFAMPDVGNPPSSPAETTDFRRPQLQVQTQNISRQPPVQTSESAKDSSPLTVDRESLMKTLPPTPRARPPMAAKPMEKDEPEQLSPAVYRPANKTPAPAPLRVSALINASPSKKSPSPIGPPRAAPGTVGSPLNFNTNNSLPSRPSPNRTATSPARTNSPFEPKLPGKSDWI